MRDRLPCPTDRLPLGESGLAVSPICVGIVDDPATITAAYTAGINFFFVTADMHWPLYEATRRGLAELLAEQPAARDELVVAAVSYLAQPEFLWLPFEEVIDAVPGLARLDVTIAGGAYGHEIDARLAVYQRHRRTRHAGARAIGATFHDRAAARRLVGGDARDIATDIASDVAIDIAFARFNPLHPGARDDLFPHVADRRSLLFNFKSTLGYLASDAAYAALGVERDYWRPRRTDYYRFALGEPALDGVLCALPGPHAVGELIDALAAGPLDADSQQYLLDLGALQRGAAKVHPTLPAS